MTCTHNLKTIFVALGLTVAFLTAATSAKAVDMTPKLSTNLSCYTPLLGKQVEINYDYYAPPGQWWLLKLDGTQVDRFNGSIHASKGSVNTPVVTEANDGSTHTLSLAPEATGVDAVTVQFKLVKGGLKDETLKFGRTFRVQADGLNRYHAIEGRLYIDNGAYKKVYQKVNLGAATGDCRSIDKKVTLSSRLVKAAKKAKAVKKLRFSVSGDPTGLGELEWYDYDDYIVKFS